MDLGEKIRSLRKERGWSQAELGERVGIPGQHVSRYETGKIQPRKKTLVALAKALEVPLEVLEEANVQKGALHNIEDPELLEYVEMIGTLEPEDQEAVKRMLRAMVSHKRAQALFAS